jgi:hypothetical protein
MKIESSWFGSPARFKEVRTLSDGDRNQKVEMALIPVARKEYAFGCARHSHVPITDAVNGIPLPIPAASPAG